MNDNISTTQNSKEWILYVSIKEKYIAHAEYLLEKGYVASKKYRRIGL